MTRPRPWWWLAGLAAVVAAGVAGLAFGPVPLPPAAVAAELINLVPGVRVESGLDEREAAVLVQLRLPRVLLGLLVGAMLALAGAAYQGVFRNPLADPYLLGVAAGAGLAATAVIALNGPRPLLPVAAFAGALGAIGLTYLLGAAGSRDGSPAALILAGVAVAAFLQAGQTWLMQRHADDLREIYSWLFGRLATGGWSDVRMLAPYVLVTAVVVLLHRRELDVLTVGDEEAAGLGLHPRRSRLILVAAASLGTAAAVSVSGLIGFVGVIVPHTVRLLVGASYRVILPLSMLFGAAFLMLADLTARTVVAPAEVPIGVITALCGAPFFVLVLRTRRRVAL